MNHQRQFKSSMSLACTCLGVRFSVFAKKTGLLDFELDTDFSQNPKNIATDTLYELCRRDESLFDGVLCLGIVEFLDSVSGTAGDAHRQMRYKALLEVVRDVGTQHEYLKWVESYYG